MERASLYRRALAPMMLLSGLLGLLAAALGLLVQIESARAFFSLWLCTAALAVMGAFVLVRRQALKDQEPFWSPPTRRVAQALAPPFAAGLVISLILAIRAEPEAAAPAVILWMMFYGCALNAAGFFMRRGIRLFGWIMVAGASLLLGGIGLFQFEPGVRLANLGMGFFFGLLHLAFGIYLHFTERKPDAP